MNRLHLRSFRARRVALRRCNAALAALATLALARIVNADGFGSEIVARVDPSVAFPLSSPQSDRFGPGGGAWLGAGVHALPYVELQAAAALFELSANGGPNVAQVFAIGGGPRIQRPRKAGWSPWVDADPMYVRTGSLDRFGIAVGAGVTFPIPRSKVLWIGPSLHYVDVVQTQVPAADSRDGHVLMAGLSVEAVFPTHAPPRPAPPPLDSDGDGVLDKDDRCPTVPGPPENGGCPDVDSDGDTVVDRLDACPKAFGPVSNHGCPLPDRDGDGLTDDVDRCPDTPGPRELQGCPDRDKDGVPDIDDHCPDAPGPKENHGCPVYKLVTVNANKITIAQKVFFAFNSAKVLPKSLPLLAEVALALHDHASLQVRVEGHTDSVGKPAYNLTLSQSRADAVRQVLVSDGVPPARLQAVGYGQTQPLETNDTAAGREVNRRVEFVITGGQPEAPPVVTPEAPVTK